MVRNLRSARSVMAVLCLLVIAANGCTKAPPPPPPADLAVQKSTFSVNQSPAGDSAVTVKADAPLVVEGRIRTNKESFQPGRAVPQSPDKLTPVAENAGERPFVAGVHLDLIYEGSDREDYHVATQGEPSADGKEVAFQATFEKVPRAGMAKVNIYLMPFAVQGPPTSVQGVLVGSLSVQIE